MKFLIAPDSYKESMSAVTAAKAVERGIRRVMPGAVCQLAPMADGGEGTAECLRYGKQGERVACRVAGPLGEPVEADFVWLAEEKTAVIEAARACGIMLAPWEKRNPLYASTYGVGELIRRALERGSRRILLTLGGSMTNDGGAGMLEALGGRLEDANGKPLARGGKALLELERVDLSEPLRLLSGVQVTVLCDVGNTLLGPEGATYVFGPQKGATSEMLPVLEAAMAHYASRIDEAVGRRLSRIPGTGAAGGLGYGLLAVCQAEFVNGAEYVMGQLGLETKIRECDYVITGEGAMDTQSLQGKVPVGVAKLAQRYGKPTVVFVGKLSGSMDSYYESGVTAVFSILRDLKPMPEVLCEGESNLEQAAENFARLVFFDHTNKES